LVGEANRRSAAARRGRGRDGEARASSRGSRLLGGIMAARRWDVLVVDDEEGVLTAAKLALKSVRVFGLGINAITAKSKAEAIERLKGLPQYGGLGALRSPLAVAFIDVVMESDTAGLELCQHIRE